MKPGHNMATPLNDEVRLYREINQYMASNKYEKIQCMSCHYQCELYPWTTIKMMGCLESKYCLWPDKNMYMKYGAQQILMNARYMLLHTGLIYVDFSRYNIRLFTNRKWIDYLTKTGLRLVLIADRFTQPLALYWKKNCRNIMSVVYASDSDNEIEKKIQLHFLGQRDGKVYSPALNENEVRVFELLIKEKTVSQIADEMSFPEKKIYAIKLSLQNKMGGRGKLNIILAG